MPASKNDIRRVDLGFFVRPASETATGAARVEPVYGYVVAHPDLTIMFDTGMGAVDPETEAHYQPCRRSVPEALAAIGVHLEEVDLVANSHLHFDHCGANQQFPNRPIVVQAVELAVARMGDYTMPQLVDFPEVSYTELDGEAELAAGMLIVPTPGHTAGHQSLVVRCGDGTVVVAGQATDFAHEYGSYHLARRASSELGHEIAARPGWMERLERLDVSRVVFAHDMAVWVRTEGD